jgi:hypothetical protein
VKTPSDFQGTGAILCLFDRKTRNRFAVSEIITIFALGSGRYPRQSNKNKNKYDIICIKRSTTEHTQALGFDEDVRRG